MVRSVCRDRQFYSEVSRSESSSVGSRRVANSPWPRWSRPGPPDCLSRRALCCFRPDWTWFGRGQHERLGRSRPRAEPGAAGSLRGRVPGRHTVGQSAHQPALRPPDRLGAAACPDRVARLEHV